jgi:5-methylthioadenosine/S-adenosylhomocysteine deaminase
MLAVGVTVGLGTDGAASNNALNLFSEMGFASLAHS